MVSTWRSRDPREGVVHLLTMEMRSSIVVDDRVWLWLEVPRVDMAAGRVPDCQTHACVEIGGRVGELGRGRRRRGGEGGVGGGEGEGGGGGGVIEVVFLDLFLDEVSP